MFEDMSYMYPAYPIICLLTMLAVLFPIPAHWKAGNIATISLAMWTWFGLLIVMVNTIVWHGNLRNPYPIWMDICNAYLAILPVGIASSTLCIQYKLWIIAGTKVVFITKTEMRRQKYATYFLCVGLPLIVCALHYVVQGHRGDIFEDIGPYASTYNVTLAFAIYYPWEPAICLISGVFSVMTIRLFLAHRKEIDEALAIGSPNANKDRYFRLMWLAAVAVAIHLPLALWSIIYNGVAIEVRPWRSWEITHSNYMRISYYSRFMMSRQRVGIAVFSIGYWAIVLCGINFFLFFGFGEEAFKQYRVILGAILKPFGIKIRQEKKRKTVKKTWVDVLLRRPGKPIKHTPSFLGSVSRRSDIVPNSPTLRRPRPEHHALPRHPQATIGSIDTDMDSPRVNFLNRAEAIKQARIAGYMRPGQVAQKRTELTERCDSISRPAYRDDASGYDQGTPVTPDLSTGRLKLQIPEKVATITTPGTLNNQRKSSIIDLDIPISAIERYLAEEIPEEDIEAQEPDEETVAAERRLAILEKNPELTKEITF